MKDEQLAEEHIIGWVKYIDHNGELPTEMETCDKDDPDAIPICRASAIRRVRQEERERCAKYIDGMDINVERCRELQLTEQAWEDALQEASQSIRSLK